MKKQATGTRSAIALIALCSSACAAGSVDAPLVGVTSAPLELQLFYTSFDTSLSPFTVTGNCTRLPSGEARCQDTASMTVSFSTAGARSIRLNYYRSTTRYDTGERLVVEYSVNGGQSWTAIENVVGTTTMNEHPTLLPAAADNTTVTLRFRSNASGYQEWFMLDEIVVVGDVRADRDCDGSDDDEDGRLDEDYVAPSTTCGVGACARQGQLVCSGGAPQDSCVAGTPATGDGTCNGIDDDCDGEVDENGCPTPEIIIDNTATAPSFTTTGTWTPSTASGTWYGSNYSHGGQNDPLKTAKWSPDIQRSGAYQVYMWYPAGTNRPAAAPITIQHDAGCTLHQNINQRLNGGRWNLLGTFDFSAARDGHVMLRGAGSGYTIADAVRFVRVGNIGTGTRCAAPRCFNPSSPPAVQQCAPLETAPVTGRNAYNTWQKVELPGTVCSDGSQYKFFVNFSSASNNLLVMFEGGGNCRDYETCTGEVFNQHGIADDYMLSAADSSPSFDRATTTNPTRNWNFVFLPYCTGDVHAGNKVGQYVSDDGVQTLTYRHKGATNMEQVVSWLDVQFANVPRMMLSGCSAGGVGSFLNYDLLRSRMRGVQCGYLFADTGPLAPSSGPSGPLYASAINAWNGDYASARIGGPACPSDTLAIRQDLGSLNLILADRYSRDRLAFTQFLSDLRSARGNYSELTADYNQALSYWREDTQALRSMYDTRTNLGYFIPYRRSDNCSHCPTSYTYAGSEIGSLDPEDYTVTLLNNAAALTRHFESSATADGQWPPDQAQQCYSPSF